MRSTRIDQVQNQQAKNGALQIKIIMRWAEAPAKLNLGI